MPHFVVDKIQNALNDRSRPLKGSKVHILGVAYKRNIDDLRESPALDILHLLRLRGAVVTYSDPYVPEFDLEGSHHASDEQALAAADCVVIVTDHAGIDYHKVLEQVPLVVDTRNALKGITSDKIVRL